MKTLLLLSLSSLSLNLWAVCNQPVDNSKVMLFVDVNNSALEIQTAEASACARGQRLVVSPRNHSEYNRATNALSIAERSRNEHRISTARTALEPLQSQTPYDAMREAMEEIKTSGSQVVNFTISGHDGGGEFGGYKGSFSRYELQELMAEYPEQNKVQSVLLLGCYTGVPNEINAWRTIFPEARMIAGYDGVAPASDKIAGHNYLADLLNREETILSQTSSSGLETYVRANVRHLNILNAGMYLNACMEVPLYYGEHDFRDMDFRECASKIEEVNEIIAETERYSSGEMEIPANTTSGALRTLYNRARRIEHCEGTHGRSINTKAIFNLLFFEGVKRNFANAYARELTEADRIFKTITLESLTAAADQNIAEAERKIAELEELKNLITQNPELYQTRITEALAAITTEEQQFLSSETNRRIYDLLESGGINDPDPATLTLIKDHPQIVTQAFDLQARISAQRRTNSVPAEELSAHMDGALAEARQLLSYAQSSRRSVVENSPIGRAWIPTEQNLRGKSRREILANMHDLSSLVSHRSLSPAQRSSIYGSIYAMQTHMVAFDNPFSWHEFSGRTEPHLHAEAIRNSFTDEF